MDILLGWGREGCGGGALGWCPKVHRYGPNGFKLHRLPIPRLGQVLGIVGTNGVSCASAWGAFFDLNNFMALSVLCRRMKTQMNSPVYVKRPEAHLTLYPRVSCISIYPF